MQSTQGEDSMKERGVLPYSFRTRDARNFVCDNTSDDAESLNLTEVANLLYRYGQVITDYYKPFIVYPKKLDESLLPSKPDAGSQLITTDRGANANESAESERLTKKYHESKKSDRLTKPSVDAEKEACEFAEWIVKNGYEAYGNKWLCLYSAYTTQQLYVQYLKTKQ